MEEYQLNFINFIKKECTKRNVIVNIVDYPLFIEGESITGSFDGNNLICTTSDGGWFSILIHEYSHFLQKLENNKFYLYCIENFVMQNLMDWWNRKLELLEDVLDKYFNAVINVEADAERKTNKLIKRWKFPIDIEEKNKSVNTLLYFYSYMRKTRNPWFDFKCPRGIPELVNNMPSKILRSYKKLPDSYEEIVTKECYQNELVRLYS